MNYKLLIKKSIAILVTLVILSSIVGSTKAQEDRVTSDRSMPTAPAQAQGPSDRAELKTFVDDLLGREMRDYHIAGAAVSVVKDGKLSFTKGYGYADLEKGIPVDSEQTIFAIGSVGQVFTWTAVVQLLVD